jgi:hypothetical protein
MGSTSTDCPKCLRPCYVDKRLWRKVICINRLCRAKFLIEDSQSLGTELSIADATADQYLRITSVSIECPTCHGPVLIRERLWQKATCINSLCREKFLIDASNSLEKMSSIANMENAPPLRDSIETPLPVKSSHRSYESMKSDPRRVRALSARRNRRRWTLIASALAILPCVVLLLLMLYTKTGMNQLFSTTRSSPAECDSSIDDQRRQAHCAASAGLSAKSTVIPSNPQKYGD